MKFHFLVTLAALTCATSIAHGAPLEKLVEIKTVADHQRCIALGTMIQANAPSERLAQMGGMIAAGHKLALAAEAEGTSITADASLTPEMAAFAKEYEALPQERYPDVVGSDVKICANSVEKLFQAMKARDEDTKQNP